MITLHRIHRALAASLVIASAVVMSSTPAHAAPFQLVKTFETPLVGEATFEFLIETQTLGVWIEIPCVDGAGSCTLTFSDVPAGTSIVLADSSVHSWFQGGNYYIRERTPLGWTFASFTSAGATALNFKPDTGELYFTFESVATDGHVTLHNVGPAVPEPGTLALAALGFALLGIRRRHLAVGSPRPAISRR